MRPDASPCCTTTVAVTISVLVEPFCSTVTGVAVVMVTASRSPDDPPPDAPPPDDPPLKLVVLVQAPLEHLPLWHSLPALHDWPFDFLVVEPESPDELPSSMLPSFEPPVLPSVPPLPSPSCWSVFAVHPFEPHDPDLHCWSKLQLSPFSRSASTHRSTPQTKPFGHDLSALQVNARQDQAGPPEHCRLAHCSFQLHGAPSAPAPCTHVRSLSWHLRERQLNSA